MASSSTRLSPAVIEADQEALVAIQSMEDYAPVNVTYTTPALQSMQAMLDATHVTEINKQNELNAARDAAVKAEHDFHQGLLGAKNQVVAQYGEDSDEVQAVGLKKKSERKTGGRRRKPKP